MSKHVHAGNVEFGYELIAALPYAYHLYLKGELKATTSGFDTAPLYWFSPDHRIEDAKRDWSNMSKVQHLPNIRIHTDRLKMREWEPPPLLARYAPEAIRFKKPTVSICNRYNREWGRPPINFFSLAVLDKLIALLEKKYQVVYINNHGMPKYQDGAPSMPLGDYAHLRKHHPKVKVIHDLVPEGGSYNETQLRVFAGCQRFITMNGGLGILASYFGGENIVYSKECREITPEVNSFYNWYHYLGGSIVKHVSSYEGLLAMVRAKWVDEQPLINIVLRCHKRQDGLARFHKSLRAQTHINWHVVAGYHDEHTWRYLRAYPYEKHATTLPTVVPARKRSKDYGAPFAPNDLLDQLGKKVCAGYITYMDDDDHYATPDALATIAAHVGANKLVLWRATRKNGPDHVIPSDANFGRIVAGDISGITFAYHCFHEHRVHWEKWRRGDYRVIRNLAKHLTIEPIDRALCVIGK